ncbi:MAG: tetratricopeptide repeat protein [Flavobacteriales bacterium]|nr:tetratricopeptide repeat protein [Flavobacteriales bacterium]
MERNKLILLAGFLVIALTAIYLNHFDNGFYFDDIHTIVNNEYIRSLDNIPEYFTNIETFGTMPNNRGYRPMVTLLNAIDYRLGGNELKPKVFHTSIYIAYLIQGLLLFLFLLNLFKKVLPEEKLGIVALLTTAFYMFHTANAETVNYIISRSDQFSTMCFLATLVLYQYRVSRKLLLYVVPLLVGLFTKEVTFMLVPVLGLYHLLFEEEATLNELKQSVGWKKIGRSILAVLPAFAVGFGLTAFNLIYMTDPARLAGGLAHPRLDYFTSQFVVVVHYIANFILPIDLSVDPAHKVTPEIFTSAKVFSLMVILSLHAIAIYCLTKKKLAPIGFGILWFFITLAPTSTINPLYQVSNDHRTFLPYIGLCLAVGWSIYLLYLKVGGKLAKRAILATSALVIAGHAYGTYQRNEVWGSDDTLWFDAVQKGPSNGRAQMNYGLVLMRDGKYNEAEPYFQKAVEILPYWPYSNVNLAILKEAQGDVETADKYFNLALRYGRDNPEPYYYYARSLTKRGKLEDAMNWLDKGHEVSPKHLKINELREQLKLKVASPEEKLAAQLLLVAKSPTADNYINLSLIQYQQKDFEGCIASCRKALELNPKSEIAYNNICSAYNAMKQWDKAIPACENALRIAPNFERAKNNLNWAKGQVSR